MTTEADVREMKAAQNIDGLIQALQAPEWRVRQQAAEALGELQSDQAINALLAIRNDENSNVRWSAVWALGKIGGDRALEVLLDSLEGDEAARNAALVVLQKIQDDRVQETLRQADLLEREAKIPLSRMLRYGSFAAIALAIVVLVLSISQNWPSQVILFGSGGLLVVALVLWLVGGSKG
jgi:HEAT repeat protein